METCVRLLPHFAILVSCVYFALSVALLATTDFGEQKNSRDIAIALAVLTGIPSFSVVVFILGVVTGKIPLI
jgi:hypothetical protein